MNSSRGLWDGTGLLLSVVTAAGDSSRTLRSSAISFSTLARTSVVGSTQSIGMELHFSVGQPSRSGPLPRVPPSTWICRPEMSLLQTKQ